MSSTSTEIDTGSRRRWLILALIGIAQLMVVLDATIVNIALPSAQADLGFSDESRQWIVTAYALAFGSLLLLGGRLGDVFGRKRVFVTGLAGFAGASALGGFATSLEMLVGARALQGAFAALLAPAALSLLTTTFTDPDERNRAFSVFGVIGASGAAIGLILGGALTEFLDWRWTMFVNLILAVPTAAVALRLLADDVVSGSRAPIDLPGTLTASAGLFALVYGLSNAESHGWASALTIAGLAAGLTLLAAFVAVERRVEHPLLPLRVVADKGRAGGFLSIAVVGAGIFGVFLFLTFYMQQTLGFSPLVSGLAFLPMMAVIMPAGAIGQTMLLPRVGPRPLVAVGMALSAVAMLMLTGVEVGSGYAGEVLPALLVMGLGLGMVFGTAMDAATRGVAGADAGVASALVNTGQQVGGSIGTALLSTLAASAAGAYATSHQAAADVLAQSAVHGYTTAFTWAAAIFAAGSIAAWLLLPSEAPEPSVNAEPVFAH
ncbi:MAG TPA: MFS transporter [Solirubrobacteraceae bacterium]|nr:MFS transporter [Solirubrobacteraceae bacterium]